MMALLLESGARLCHAGLRKTRITSASAFSKVIYKTLQNGVDRVSSLQHSRSRRAPVATAGEDEFSGSDRFHSAGLAHGDLNHVAGDQGADFFSLVVNFLPVMPSERFRVNLHVPRDFLLAQTRFDVGRGFRLPRLPRLAWASTFEVAAEPSCGRSLSGMVENCA
jgi:hypothetical protein